MEYSTALYDTETVERWSRQYNMLLQQLSQQLAGSVHDLGIISDQEKVVLENFSIGEERPAYFSAPLVHEAFEATAAQFPERPCICYEGTWLTYGEVDAQASRLAGLLASLGIAPGVVVGLVIDRSLELIVSILGVLKAGGCYLPCDPSYPDDRLAIYLEDSKAKVVLAQTHHMGRAHGMVDSSEGVRVIDVGVLDEVVSDVPALITRAGPEDPCYIIFTSGSTGRPKGVVVAHRGLRDLLPWLVTRHELGKCLLSCLSELIAYSSPSQVA